MRNGPIKPYVKGMIVDKSPEAQLLSAKWKARNLANEEREALSIFSPRAKRPKEDDYPIQKPVVPAKEAEPEEKVDANEGHHHAHGCTL